jgi:hypothetical protein
MIAQPHRLRVEKRARALYAVIGTNEEVVLTFFNDRDACRFVRAASYSREAK